MRGGHSKQQQHAAKHDPLQHLVRGFFHGTLHGYAFARQDVKQRLIYGPLTETD
jgi:hypothetical protein